MGFEPTVLRQYSSFQDWHFQPLSHSSKRIKILNIMSKNIAVLNHIKELQFRIFYTLLSFIICFCILYYHINETTYICIRPLLLNENLRVENLIFTDLSEVFFCTLKLTFFLSNYITINIIIYHLYFFIVPGTYKYEQYKLLKLLSLSLIFMYFSLFVTYQIFIPLFWEFFLTQHISIDTEIFRIDYQGKIVEYINLLNKILLGFLLSFQLPLILTFMLYNNLIKVTTLTKYRSINIIICFICGALFSPPDVFSQIALALPLCCLYEINILFGFYLNKRKTLVQIN